MNTNRKKIAEQLVLARKSKGITQGEMALKLKISQPALAYIESGKANMTVDTISNYAWEVGMDICEILRLDFVPVEPEKKAGRPRGTTRVGAKQKRKKVAKKKSVKPI